MAEYVCADGRMSVNGICSVVNQNDNNNNIIPTKTFDQKYQSIEDIPTKDYSKDVKSNFQWDFDKVGNKIENFGSTIKGNINAYDKYVEEKLGISTNVSNVFRAGAVVKGAATYGALGAVAPFLIPFMAGGALNNSKQKKEQYEKDLAINKAEIEVIQSGADTQYQNQMTTDNKDFSVSGPDTSANPTGKSNQASSERGYALHG